MNMPSHRDLTRLQSGGSTPGGSASPLADTDGPVMGPGTDHQRTTSEFSNATFNVQDEDDDTVDGEGDGEDGVEEEEAKGVPAAQGLPSAGSLGSMGQRTASGRRLQMVPMLENARREAAAQEEAKVSGGESADPVVTPAD